MAITGLTGAPVHRGSWFGLPDIGLTETLQGRKSTSPQVLGASSPLASSAKNVSMMPANYTPYTAPKTTSVNSRTATTTQTPYQDPFSQITQLNPSDQMGGGPSQLDVINEQFNQFNSLLDQQEGMANQNYSDTMGLYNTQKTNAENQYKTEKTQQTEGIKKSENLNLAKVRQLLQDLQQSNAARTAITGGGSTSDVLAERFGREAQSRLGNVMDQSQQAIQRVNTFYDNAITKLNDTYQSSILQAKQSLDENLFNIRQARVQSASAKQQASLDAWTNYYNNVNQAKLQAAQFKAQYDMWKQQQDSALAATGGFNEANAGTFNTGLTDSYSEMPQAGVLQQQQPGVNPIYQTFRPKKGQEDEEAARLGLNYSPMVGSQYGIAQ